MFSSKASMQQHMVRHGAVEARFPCPHCPRRFIYNSILRCHLASAHSAERDCVCEVCGATFTCNSALNAHKLSHQEERPHCVPRERPFSCPLCEKRFSQRSHVRSHMQLHVELRPTDGSEAVVPAVPLSAPCPVAPRAGGRPGGAPCTGGIEVAALLPRPFRSGSSSGQGRSESHTAERRVDLAGALSSHHPPLRTDGKPRSALCVRMALPFFSGGHVRSFVGVWERRLS
ncbi:replication initiator 1-like, partial [Amphibalanus amphitrite]|uniref:replication initiator 1-like n=1 Tax=Amphibalanus amphitrite TaxID=1232801 RepID=UPI001C91EE48